MMEPAWLRYPRHIGGQITLVVLTAIVLSLSLVIFALVMVRPENNPQPSQAAIEAFLGTMRLLDGARENNSESSILSAAMRAFPNLKIATSLPFPADNRPGPEDREILFLRQRLGPGFSVVRLPADAGEPARLAIGISPAMAAQFAQACRHSRLRHRRSPDRQRNPGLVVACVFLLLLWATKALTAPLSRRAGCRAVWPGFRAPDAA